MEPKVVEKAKRTKEALRVKLSEDQRSFAWFYGKYLADSGVIYHSFMGMLNGYGNIKPSIEDVINKYLAE